MADKLFASTLDDRGLNIIMTETLEKPDGKFRQLSYNTRILFVIILLGHILFFAGDR